MTACLQARLAHGGLKSLFLGLLLLGLSGGWEPAFAAKVTLNLRDTDIGAVIDSISQITGKNFIVDPRVKGRVSIISAKPMDEKELYEVFLAMLTVNGFAAVPDGAVIKIIPAAGAKQEPIPTVEGPAQRESNNQVVTTVVQVQNVAAAQIVPILRPLIPPQGHLAAYAPTNVLIISDTAGNVDRLTEIIRRIDRASDEDVEVVRLQHAVAADVVRTLTSLEQATAQAGGQPGVGAPGALRMVADERTNSILLSGDKNNRLRLRGLIVHLDTPLAQEGNTQVIYLRYAKAEDLKEVLTGVSKKIVQQTGQQPGAPPPQGGAPGQGSRRQDEIDIQADKATNALVITGPVNALRALRSVIAQLDVRRAQVLVEAAIAEISANRTAELGVQWIVDGTQSGYLVGVTNFTLGTSLASIAQTAIAIANGTSTQTSSSLSGAGSASPGLSSIRGMQLGVGSLSSSTRFAMLISALSADSDSNVLSTPTLVTMDNEEAEITVGQNLPFIAGTSLLPSGGGSTQTSTPSINSPFQSIDRQDVGLKLKIKPQINEGNAVRLELSQEVSNVLEQTAQGPITTKRDIKTTVLVEDGQILVLGGLVDDTLNESVQKVPGLGDIPVLGNLFRYRSTTKNRRNLMIFLHPVILRDPMQATVSTNDKYSYIRNQEVEARQRGVALLPEVRTPLLVPPEEVQRQRSLLPLQPERQPSAEPPPAAPPPPAPPPAVPPPRTTTPAPSPALPGAGFGDR